MASQPSSSRLVATALFRVAAGILSVAALLFLPAGTLDYWQGWLYMAALFAPILGMAAVLLLKDPALLERRMRLGERQGPQQRAIAVSSLVLLAIVLVPAFDRRFTWSQVPTALVLLADLLVLLGFLLFILTIRENRYASRVVEVQEQQPVISTGPYALVRHPMYLAFVIIFGATPLALGSWWGLLPALLLPVALAYRAADEEALLARELAGYDEYRRKVRWRLIPFIW